MSINIRCGNCKAEFKLGHKKCAKCGDSLGVNRRYKVAVKLPDGRWFKRQTDTLEAAQRLERKVRADVFEGRHFERRKSVTLAMAWEQYLEWATVNKATWQDDRQKYTLYIKQHLENMPMDRITVRHVEAILDHMRGQTSRLGKPYKPETLSKPLRLLKRVYNWSIQRKLYEGENPCKFVKIPAYDNRVTACMQKNEIQELLKVLDGWPNPRAALVVAFALYTGRRKGEILALTWENVNLDAGFVTFPGITTKNRRTQTIPVNDSALAILKKCQELRNGSHVFTNRQGERYTASGFDTIRKRIWARAGLSAYRFHDLRHSFASWLASSGEVDIYTLQTLLGHKTPAMTQRYAHLLNSSLRKAAAVADNIFPG